MIIEEKDIDSYKRFLTMSCCRVNLKEVQLGNGLITIVYSSYFDIEFVASFNSITGQCHDSFIIQMGKDADSSGNHLIKLVKESYKLLDQYKNAE